MKVKQFRVKFSFALVISSLLVIALAIMLISGYVYAYCSKYAIDRSVMYQQKSLESAGEVVIDFLNDIDFIAASIGENVDINKILIEPGDDAYAQMQNSQEIASILSSFVYSNKRISSINIISNNFNNINNMSKNGVISEEFIALELIDRTYKVTDKGWFVLKDGDIVQNSLSGVQDESTVCFFKSLYYKGTNKRLGMLLISCSERELYEIIRHSVFDTGTQAMIVTDNNIVISHSDKALLGSIQEKMPSSNVLLNKSKDLLTVSHTLQEYKWTIVQNLQLNYFTREIDQMLNYILIMSIFVLGIAAVVAILISSIITRPLKQLTETVQQISKTNLQTNNNRYLICEIDTLNNRFNEMVIDIRQLMHDVKAEEKKKHATHLKLLQAEINPHFIYNTIELINYIAQKNNNVIICDIVHSFGRFLRLSLNNGKDYLTIAQEVEHASSYIKLQAYKYENSFTVDWNISPEILDSFTIKLMLQPLIENSIIHGFTKSVGTICINGYKSGDDVIFTICDNGVGMSTKTAEQILKKSTQGYGVYNVNERIKSAFGQQYGLKYSSVVNTGTQVTVQIPYLKNHPEVES